MSRLDRVFAVVVFTGLLVAVLLVSLAAQPPRDRQVRAQSRKASCLWGD